MKALLNTPVERVLGDWWGRLDDVCRKAFFAVLAVNVLAFGFEMTNLTLHHDDVIQILIQDTILGHYLGRFGLGWLHAYTQNHYFVPFLQMAQGVVWMSVYGIVVARLWGARKFLDIALVASILCVFPYMAQTYQYNTAMATYTLAHLLAALAVVFSIRATAVRIAVAALLYVAAFSIYQTVAANAATIFVLWLLCRLLFPEEGSVFASRETLRASVGVVVAVVAGGLLYLAAVSQIHIEFDAYQAPESAFRLGGATNLSQSIPEMWAGTKSFFVWPERFFPSYLKGIQLVFLVVAGACCLWLPARLWQKATATALLVLAMFTPRLVQLLHPQGHYHSLTLTAYALLIAATVMIAMRAGRVLGRNVAIVGAFVLLGGYLLQCNWISTVNYLNTAAHFQTLTQILARARSLPAPDWDGKTIVVAGRYEMSSDYPFTTFDAVASKFLDATHMQDMARLLRDEATFAEVDQTMPDVVQYVREHHPWPHPDSVAVVGKRVVVVLSKLPAAPL